MLNALRSHDPNLASEINKLVLTESHGDSEVTNRIIIRHAYSHSLRSAEMPESKMLSGIASEMVKEVGDINYYDKYGEKLGDAANTIEARIHNRIKSDVRAKQEVGALNADLREVVGDSVTLNATVKIISQHVVLSHIFNKLFSGEFTTHNPVAKVLESVAKKIGMREELRALSGFYADVDREVDGIDTRKARQNFIKKIYGNFFESADKKGAERHGVVYTPIEVVDFIIHSVEHLLQKHFGVSVNDRAVKILDPFAGTGTFLTRLLESGLIEDNLYEKYNKDLFADELILLAYYVATINIETTYSSLRRGGRYVPFKGISYTDTLRINPLHREDPRHRQEQRRLSGQFQAAHERIMRQRSSHVHVIIGNPPYSAGQSDYDDQNPNQKYPVLDERIKKTYLARAPTKGKGYDIYDSYIRSLRWASDRIGGSGIIAVITNAGFLRSGIGAGVRASLVKEFDEIWCFDLRGNQNTHGLESRREGGKIFGSGSKAAVAVTLLVKNPGLKRENGHSVIYYKDIGDYLTRGQKLEIIQDAKHVGGVRNWETIRPDKHHDWLDQRSDDFYKYAPMGTKGKTAVGGPTIFKTYSLGTGTNRDVWAYNSSSRVLAKNMKTHIDYCVKHGPAMPKRVDLKQAKWSPKLTHELQRSKPEFRHSKIRIASYRPFFKQYLFFDRVFNHMQASMPRFFPCNDTKNPTICVPDKFMGEFYTLITDVTPDLEFIHHGQCFPLHFYENGHKKENVTDVTVSQYRIYYGDDRINKNDVFYYVYGLLHHAAYREKFAHNLIRELPRVPMAPDFAAFCDAGKKLSDLHLNFETCARYNLGKPKFALDKFRKLSFGRRKTKDGRDVRDETVVRADGVVLFENVPTTAYRINGRTPLEWIVDRYKITTDKNSCITNDPCTGTDIVPVIERAVYMGLESERIINTLPKEFEPGPEWKTDNGSLDKW